MKIIFDNEEQMTQLFKNTCPSIFGGEFPGDSHYDCLTYKPCKNCWEKHIELEVKHD